MPPIEIDRYAPMKFVVALHPRSRDFKAQDYLRYEYPVTIAGITFADVLAAYESMSEAGEVNQGIMADILTEFFLQHDKLRSAFKIAIESSTVTTPNSTRSGFLSRLAFNDESLPGWNGQGIDSPYICALISGFYLADEIVAGVNSCGSLAA